MVESIKMGQPQFNENDFKKMAGFIKQLFVNDNFAHLPIPQIEGMLINFLKNNETNLSKVFASEEYYPNFNWRELQVLFLSVLKNVTIEKLKPELTNLIRDKVNFHFLTTYFKNGGFDSDAEKENMIGFILDIIVNRDVRKGFDVTFKLLKSDYIDLYIEKVFERREHIFNALSRQESLYHLEPTEMANLLKTVLLLRNVAYMKLSVQKGNNQSGGLERFNLFDVGERPALKKIFLSKLNSKLLSLFLNFPKNIIKSAVDSNRDCNEEIEILSASARIIGIFAKRGEVYNPSMVVDRGAEMQDKSWFKTATANYLYHGLDKMMLEEFYKIASDENW